MSRVLRVLLVVLSGCASTPSPTIRRRPPDRPVTASTVFAPPAVDTAPVVDETDRWRAAVQQVAVAYPSWGLVDEQARWAPERCLLVPAAARISAAPAAGSGHGQKLYFLSALDPAAYGAPPTSAIHGRPQPIEGFEQVIVKEAFAPTPSSSPGSGQLHRLHDAAGPVVRPVEHQGRLVGPGEFLGLYVMLRGREDAPGTDHGWVYATVGPDARTVLQAGRIATCMGCHEAAPRDRLFGPPPHAPDLGEGSGW